MPVHRHSRHSGRQSQHLKGIALHADDPAPGLEGDLMPTTQRLRRHDTTNFANQLTVGNEQQ